MKGQPVIEGQRATRHLKVRATEGQLQDLRSVAQELGVTQSDIIRDAVNEFVADFRERKVFTDGAGGTPKAPGATLTSR